MNGQKCECVVFALVILLVASCTPAVTEKQAIEAVTTPPPLPVASDEPLFTVVPASPTASLDESTQPPLPLSEAGPYFPGKMRTTFDYPRREGGSLDITIWYPAVKPEGYTGRVASKAAPDKTGAPYPLLLASTTSGNEFAAHLVSYGFVVAGIDSQETSDSWGSWLVDFPLATLATLDYLAANPPQELQGMIDAEHAGAFGYSFDGYNALALSGARVDPEYYLEQCARAAAHQPPLDERWTRYICAPAGAWEGFSAHAGELLGQSQDGLWQPMTDPRIRAVMPMAPEGAWLFGERGLAAVDRPALIIGATEDRSFRGCPYQLEAVPIFERLGTPDRGLISFVGQGHMMIWDVLPKARMAHFAVAFFGYHLQKQEAYARYFSEAYVSQVPGLAWGPVPDDRPPFDK